MDDDTYVNLVALEKLVRKYDHKEDWYLGKPSISHPLEINNPDKPGVCVMHVSCIPRVVLAEECNWDIK